MKKVYGMLTLLMVLALSVCGALAEQAEATVPQFPAEYAAEFEQANAALLAHSPEAVVEFAVRERDDGRNEWSLFFVLNGQLGEGEVIEPDFTVRRVQLYQLPEGGLTVAQAVEMLKQEKGELEIIDLEIDHDKGRLCYEGEASLNGKRYGFEISASGKIMEWERD